MNRYLALGCLGLGLMVSPLLSSPAGSAVPTNPKIGVIDIEDTLSTTPAGKRANDAFEKTRKAKQAELDKRQEDLKKADADLDKQKTVLKPEMYAGYETPIPANHNTRNPNASNERQGASRRSQPDAEPAASALRLTGEQVVAPMITGKAARFVRIELPGEK